MREVVKKLNEYGGDNIWQDIIWHLPNYDDEMTHMCDPNYRGTIVVFNNGTYIEYDEPKQRWESGSDNIAECWCEYCGTGKPVTECIVNRFGNPVCIQCRDCNADQVYHAREGRPFLSQQSPTGLAPVLPIKNYWKEGK